MIESGDVEPNRIAKTVLVIDEAQDMGPDEYRLVRALVDRNEDMRVIAVGDDDQGIFEFRGSDSSYLYQLANSPGSRLIEMTDNYRSKRHIVDFANEFVRYIQNRIKSSPIKSMSNADGYVSITKHQSEYMYDAVVREVAKNAGHSSVCVLTHTNEEAVVTVALLQKQGIKASLIQSLGNFRFCNLAEVRYFMKNIERNISSPIIPDDVWQSALSATDRTFARSAVIPYVTRCVEIFEQINKAKYLSDFKEFVFESSIEDFRPTGTDEVIVSTIHRSKGREFDNVYMLVPSKSDFIGNDRKLRALYVGMTRARSRLMIHTDSCIFDNMPADGHLIDRSLYTLPRHIVLQLSHRDVYLRFFTNIKREVLAMQAGDSLTFKDNMFYGPKGNAIAKLSKGMEVTLAEWQNRGYNVVAASVMFIVAWKPRGASRDVEEHAVLLPDLTLEKQLNIGTD